MLAFITGNKSFCSFHAHFLTSPAYLRSVPYTPVTALLLTRKQCMVGDVWHSDDQKVSPEMLERLLDDEISKGKEKERRIVVINCFKIFERFWPLLTSWSCEKVNWVSQRVTNKFLGCNMLLNCLSVLNIEIHNANKEQATGVFFLESSKHGQVVFTLPMRSQPWLGSAQRCRIPYLEGTVGETDVSHYCFPRVKFDFFLVPRSCYRD